MSAASSSKSRRIAAISAWRLRSSSASSGPASVRIALAISSCTCSVRGTALSMRGSGGFMCLISVWKAFTAHACWLVRCGVRSGQRAVLDSAESSKKKAVGRQSVRGRHAQQTQRCLVETDKIKMTKHRRLTAVMHAEPIGSILPRPGRVVGRYLVALVVDNTVISPIAGPPIPHHEPRLIGRQLRYFDAINGIHDEEMHVVSHHSRQAKIHENDQRQDHGG